MVSSEIGRQIATLKCGKTNECSQRQILISRRDGAGVINWEIRLHGKGNIKIPPGPERNIKIKYIERRKMIHVRKADLYKKERESEKEWMKVKKRSFIFLNFNSKNNFKLIIVTHVLDDYSTH